MAGNIEQIEWYLAREGQQFGPLSDSELKKIVDLGHLKSDDLLWRDGMEEWEKSEKIFPPPAPPKPIFTAPPKPIFKDPNAPGPDESFHDGASHGEPAPDAPPSQAQANDQAETSTGTAGTDADQAPTEASDGEIADAEADDTINGAAETADNPEDDTADESVEDILETIAIDSNDDGSQDADANKEDAEFDRDVGTDKSADLGAGKEQTDQPVGAAKNDTASSLATDTSTENSANTANGSGELIGDDNETSAADPGKLEDAATSDSAQDAATANSDQSSYETGGKNDKDNKDNKDNKVDEPKSKTKSRFKRNSIFRSKKTADADQDPDKKIASADNSGAQDQSQSADAAQSDPEAKIDDKASADTGAKAEDDAPTTTGSDLAPGIALKNGAEAGQSGGDAAAEAGSQSADDTNNTSGKAGGKTNDTAGDETVQPDASPSPDAKKSRFSFVKSLSLFRGSEPASADSKTDSKTTSSNNDTTEPDKASITDQARHKDQLDHGKNKGPGNNAGTIAGKVAAIETAATLTTPAKTRHPEAAAKTEPDKLNDNAKRGQQKVEKVDLDEIAKATIKSKKYRDKPAAMAEPQAPAPRQHGTHNIQRPHAATESRQGSRLGSRQSLQQTAALTVSAGPGSTGPVSAGAAPSAAISSGLISSGSVPNNASSDQRVTATPQARDARRGNRANHSPDGHRATSEHGWPADPRDAGAAANRQSAAQQRRRPQHGDQRTAASVAVAAQQQNGTTSHTAPRVQTPTHNRSAHGAPRSKAAPAPVLNSIAVRQAARVPASPAELNASLPAHAAPAGQIAPGNPAAGTAARGTAAPGQVARGPATRGQTTPAQAAPGAAAQRPPTPRHGVSGQALRGQVAARRAATGQAATGRAATGQAVPPYIAGASQVDQGSIEALREPRRKRRRVVLPLLLLSAIGGAGWLTYTGQIEIPEQVQHYYSKAVSIGKSLAASYIPGSGNKPGSVASKSPAATTNGQAPGAGNSLQVVLNKQPSSAPQLAVPQAVTLPGAADATSGSPGPGIAKTGQVIIFPQGQTPPATSSILSPSDAAQGALDNAASQPPSGSTQITRQIPAAPVLAPILAPVPVPVPAQPPGPPQNPLLSSQLWRYIEQEFPEWYEKRASEAMTLKEDNLDDHAIVRLMDQKMIALRRRYASTALASSQSHLENIAASFLTMVNALSKHSVTACYGFISHGEAAPEVAKLLQSQDYSRHLDAQSLAIIQAVVDGKNLPQTHKPPKPEDYRALAAELTKRGWSSSDLQLFTDPVALSNAKPAKVCSMVQDWFAAQLALPNSAAQLRLLVQSLRPVIAG